MSIEKMQRHLDRAAADGRIDTDEALTIVSRERDPADHERLLFGDPLSVGRLVDLDEVGFVAALLGSIDRGELEASPAAKVILEAFLDAGPDSTAKTVAMGLSEGALRGGFAAGMLQLGPQGLLIGAATGGWGQLALIAGGAVVGSLVGLWTGMHGGID